MDLLMGGDGPVSYWRVSGQVVERQGANTRARELPTFTIMLSGACGDGGEARTWAARLEVFRLLRAISPEAVAFYVSNVEVDAKGEVL